MVIYRPSQLFQLQGVAPVVFRAIFCEALGCNEYGAFPKPGQANWVCTTYIMIHLTPMAPVHVMSCGQQTKRDKPCTQVALKGSGLKGVGSDPYRISDMFRSWSLPWVDGERPRTCLGENA